MKNNRIEILSPLIEKAWESYNKHKDFIVKDSFPILYFGDIEAYDNSKRRIITVGINPSDKEFKKEGDSFIRFPDWKGNRKNLTQVLNDYFKKDHPYKNWFNSYEPILNGANCSFYENEDYDRAIHTDICSPLATKKTWSELGRKQQQSLIEDGFELWKLLLDELEPDIILISVGREHFERMRKKIDVSKGTCISRFTDRKDRKPRSSYYIYKYSLKKTDAKIIYGCGQPALKPFFISDLQKKEIGKKIEKMCCKLP